MKYILTETTGGYTEIPAAGQKEELKENEWQDMNGRSVFLLGEEVHIFDRPEELRISAGNEAEIRMEGTPARLYLKGDEMLLEPAGEKWLYLNQQSVGEGRVKIAPGDVLFLHSLKIIFDTDQVTVAGSAQEYTCSLQERCRMDQPFEGFPVYKRSPRLIRRLSTEKIALELPGKKEKRDKKGLIATILPPLGMAAVTVGIGLLMGRGIYMLMSASATGMTVIFSGVKYVNDNKELKEKNKNREKRYIEYLWKKQGEIAQAYKNEQNVYRFQYPSVEELCRKVHDYDSRIYERVQSDDDFLTVAVGHSKGGTSFRIDSKEQQWDAEEDPLADTARELRQRFSVIDRPKVIDLKKAHLGLVGEKENLHRQIRLLVSQLVFFQSYHDLQIIAVYDPKYEDEFAWMRWLPHTRLQALNVLGMIHSERTRDMILGSMNQILKDRRTRLEEGKKEARFMPHYLFLIDEPSFVMDHAVMEYLRMDGDELGFSIIYTSYLRANLPEYIGTVLLLENSKEATLLLEEREYKKQKLELYQEKGTDFEWMARDLGVLEHEQGITSHIPKSVTFFEMYGVQHPEELNIRGRWQQSQSHKSLAVPLGMRAAADVLSLNLHEKAHGPHGLVAGTTGSGKSETIQSYILSLAVNFHPHEVGLLLIDYKGGGMANLFKNLPHLLGTITNLDGSESMRALASVKAELSRRQRVFSEHGVNHINGYMKLFKAGEAAEPIPHLFIISDEFAELKKEQPDFMKELVSAARIGRSLGVHLILATQKPTGVVDDQIWSNSKFKLCLKVQDESDSKEVLKTPDAASITLPGRAYLQVGNNEIYELFQSAWSGAAYIKEQEKDVTLDERIYTVNELGQGELINQDLSGKKEEQKAVQTQLDVVIDHIRDVYDREEAVEVKRPWLPPLEPMIISPYTAEDTEDVPMDEEAYPGEEEKLNLSVCIGRIDIPETQSQEELELDFAKDGNLLFVASSGYGKTVFLTTIVASLAILNDVDLLNFYILDYGNSGMMAMKELPHTAEYISIDEEERYWKFKKKMASEMKLRKKLFARYAVSSLEAYNELAEIPLKALMIAIDHFDVIKEMGIEDEEVFTKLTRDGLGLGIYVVATTTRINSIRQATLNNFKNKIAGYNFDENEIFLAVGRSPYKQAEIRGRALIKQDDVHVLQIYTMAPCDNEVEYSRSLKKLTKEIRELYPGKEAPHIPVLPDELYASMLPDYEAVGEEDYQVGLDTDRVQVRGFEKSASPFVIIGGTGTGKTNMLRVLVDQAREKGKTYVFDSRSMELFACASMEGVCYVREQEQTAGFIQDLTEEIERRKQKLEELMESRPGTNPKKLVEEMGYFTVVVDDVDDFIEFIKPEMNKVAPLLKECGNLGITNVISVHAAKVRGIDEVNKLVKQASNGLVLSSQGVTTIFPISSMKELPQFGDGLLFKNGTYRRLRLPKYAREE